LVYHDGEGWAIYAPLGDRFGASTEPFGINLHWLRGIGRGCETEAAKSNRKSNRNSDFLHR
jgi:hypothetical protein